MLNPQHVWYQAMPLSSINTSVQLTLHLTEQHQLQEMACQPAGEVRWRDVLALER